MDIPGVRVISELREEMPPESTSLALISSAWMLLVFTRARLGSPQVSQVVSRGWLKSSARRTGIKLGVEDGGINRVGVTLGGLVKVGVGSFVGVGVELGNGVAVGDGVDVFVGMLSAV